jgi:hypothetical protein
MKANEDASMNQPKEKLELLAQIHKLRGQRNRQIKTVKERYAGRISEIHTQLAKLRDATVFKTGIERYLEPADAPPRFCPGCGEKLLAATIANAQRFIDVLDFTPVAFGQRAPDTTILRMLRMKGFCCGPCREAGKGRHAYRCASVTQVERLEREIADGGRNG